LVAPVTHTERKPPHGVSYVVTVYNKEAFLETTLRSLLDQQGDFEREYVVVDDGSTDRSVEIARDLVGGRPDGRVVVQANSGPACALNAGVRAATMPAVKPMDGDDYMAPDGTLRMLPGMVLPRVGLVYAECWPLSHEGASLVVERTGEPPRYRVVEKPLRHAVRSSVAGCTEVMSAITCSIADS